MSFINTIEKLAETLGGALTGGTLPVIVEIGKDVLNLIDEAKMVVNSSDAAALTAIRDELEPKVMAHADATEKTLRGS
jgi:hypothetical protein